MRNFMIAAAVILLMNSSGLLWRTLTASVEDASLAQGEGKETDPLPVPLPIPFVSAVPTEPYPIAIRLPVPFSSQAPAGSWQQPWIDACEEMSFLMVKSFMEGSTWTADTAARAIHEFVAWEKKRGYGGSITLEELAEVIGEKYPEYRAIISADVSIENIEHILQQGSPIIVPTAGRELNNPYFSNGGPWYHMLVITGYDATHFITNDPGTEAGEGYSYSKEHLIRAVHNWTGLAEEIGQGKPLLMIVENRFR